MKKALITSDTGQDGACLGELLLDKGHEVHGIKRRSSPFDTARIGHLYVNPHDRNARFSVHYGDLTDTTNLIRIMQEVQPDEVYTLAAQSHVAVSFETPEYTGNADGIGTLRLLDAIRILGLGRRPGTTTPPPISSTARCTRYNRTRRRHSTPVRGTPAAELYSYWITVNHREAYGTYTSNGILSNHESEQRGDTFVTCKITRAAAPVDAFGDYLYLAGFRT